MYEQNKKFFDLFKVEKDDSILCDRREEKPLEMITKKPFKLNQWPMIRQHAIKAFHEKEGIFISQGCSSGLENPISWTR